MGNVKKGKLTIRNSLHFFTRGWLGQGVVGGIFSGEVRGAAMGMLGGRGHGELGMGGAPAASFKNIV